MEAQLPPSKVSKISMGDEQEKVIKLLEERLERHNNNRKATQDKLHEICGRLRAQIDELKYRINKELEERFILEDDRLQAAFNELHGNKTSSALQKAKAELLVEQSYEILENKEEEEKEEEDDDEEEEEEEEDDDDDDDDDDDEMEEDTDEEDEDEKDSVKSNFDLTTLYKLKAEKHFASEMLEIRKPTNVHVVNVNRGRVSVEFTCLNPDEGKVLLDNNFMNLVKYKCSLFKKGNEQESKEYSLDKKTDDSFAFTPDIIEAETKYEIRVKMVVVDGDRESEWSDEIPEFTTPGFKECCVWKKCPDDVDDEMKYSVDENNPRIATRVDDDNWCTIIGNTYIPSNTVTSWNIKILKSKGNDGDHIWIGIAPSDINHNFFNCDKCGWYFHCRSSTLFSGPPHKYSWKEYGPKKGPGKYVHTGDSVGVVVDTTKGDLSFVLDNVNLGVAFERIPLDKPLVPCVVLGYKDFIELD